MARMLYLRDITVDVLVRCRACEHTGILPRDRLVKRFGETYPVLSIAPHYRCSKCESRDVESLPAPPARPSYEFITPDVIAAAQADDAMAGPLAALRGLLDSVRAVVPPATQPPEPPPAAARPVTPSPVPPTLPVQPFEGAERFETEPQFSQAWDADTSPDFPAEPEPDFSPDFAVEVTPPPPAPYPFERSIEPPQPTAGFDDTLSRLRDMIGRATEGRPLEDSDSDDDALPAFTIRDRDHLDVADEDDRSEDDGLFEEDSPFEVGSRLSSFSIYDHDKGREQVSDRHQPPPPAEQPERSTLHRLISAEPPPLDIDAMLSEFGVDADSAPDDPDDELDNLDAATDHDRSDADDNAGNNIGDTAPVALPALGEADEPVRPQRRRAPSDARHRPPPPVVQAPWSDLRDPDETPFEKAFATLGAMVSKASTRLEQSDAGESKPAAAPAVDTLVSRGDEAIRPSAPPVTDHDNRWPDADARYADDDPADNVRAENDTAENDRADDVQLVRVGDDILPVAPDDPYDADSDADADPTATDRPEPHAVRYVEPQLAPSQNKSAQEREMEAALAALRSLVEADDVRVAARPALPPTPRQKPAENIFGLPEFPTISPTPVAPALPLPPASTASDKDRNQSTEDELERLFHNNWLEDDDAVAPAEAPAPAKAEAEPEAEAKPAPRRRGLPIKRRKAPRDQAAADQPDADLTADRQWDTTDHSAGSLVSDAARPDGKDAEMASGKAGKAEAETTTAAPSSALGKTLSALRRMLEKG